MNITIVAIGKIKAGPELDLFEHYSKRIPWKITVKELDIKKQVSSEQRKAEEAALLLAACKDADHIIALDEHGSELSSVAFSAHLQKQKDTGARNIIFIIGGADGLHETVHKKANLLLSFGRITWPHMLMRGLLAEQIYRACTIMNNHPYHRQ